MTLSETLKNMNISDNEDLIIIMGPETIIGSCKLIKNELNLMARTVMFQRLMEGVVILAIDNV